MERTNEKIMSFQERRSLVAIISSIGIAAIYFAYMLQRAAADGVDVAQDSRFWAASILILIPVSIVARIIIYIVFSITNTIATREEEPTFMDERDKLIELKASQNGSSVFIMGFILSLVTVVIGLPPAAMFIALIVAGMLSALITEVSQLLYYRRGV
jgi:hypothetical protein